MEGGMKAEKILTRENKPTDELQRTVEEIHNGFKLVYTEVYYLDYEVNEDTGMINRQNLVEFYTRSQVSRNLKTLNSSYLFAKAGRGLTPEEWKIISSKFTTGR